MAPSRPQRSVQAWLAVLRDTWATLCISNRISKVKMGKMLCCKITKGPPVGIEPILLRSRSASKSHQRIEIENNYNQEEHQMRTGTGHMLFPIYKTIRSFKVTNHTEVLKPCQSKSSNSLLLQEIWALSAAELALSRCCLTWMRWTSQENTKIIWSNNYQRICHTLRESSTIRSS